MMKISINGVTRCVLVMFSALNLVSSAEKCSLRTDNDLVNENGLFKTTSENYANMTNKWSSVSENNKCYDEMFDHSLFKEENHPTVFLSIFIDKPTPFFDEFLDKIENIHYPKGKIILSITTLVEYHKEQVDKFIGRIGNQYNASFAFHRTTKDMTNARNFALKLSISYLCDYLFYVESEVHLDNLKTLKILIAQNRNIIAPMLTGPFTTRFNFRKSLSKERLYAGSLDYSDIYNYNKTGIWSVSQISSCYLIKRKMIKDVNISSAHGKDNHEFNKVFSKYLREKGVFMYIDNEYNFGHLIDSVTFNVTLKNPEMYQFFENRYDWEQRYLHPDYKFYLDPNKKPTELCPDVFWFPIVTEQFCKELIEIVELFGWWSTYSEKLGINEDEYDQTSSKDITMLQVGLREIWLNFINEYISPLTKLVYHGYISGKHFKLSQFFVSKYNNSLGITAVGPHYDDSTYTLNIALNFRERDYQGGGCHFLRYNCKVVNTKVGWMLMHPGLNTHYHQGIDVTNGSRYILVSFVDPFSSED